MAELGTGIRGAASWGQAPESRPRGERRKGLREGAGHSDWCRVRMRGGGELRWMGAGFVAVHPGARSSRRRSPAVPKGAGPRVDA